MIEQMAKAVFKAATAVGEWFGDNALTEITADEKRACTTVYRYLGDSVLDSARLRFADVAEAV